jgi:hypothetical protein
MSPPDYERQVFINCPFDPGYQEVFDAITFGVFDCGFRPRSAREIDDGSQVRIDKIFEIIDGCKFGIHDISRTEVDPKTKLPRFNMPLELGIFLGAKRFGKGRQREKVALILDSSAYRYQSFISDISGQDIHTHDGSARIAISAVRDWLRAASPTVTIAGGEIIAERFAAFSGELPAMCRDLRLSRDKLTFADLAWVMSEWLRKNAA